MAKLTPEKIEELRNALPALFDLASHSLASASGGEDAGLCKRLEVYRDALVSPEPRDSGLNIGPNMIACRLDEAASSIRSLSAQLAEARAFKANWERRSVGEGMQDASRYWEARWRASESEAAALREIERLYGDAMCAASAFLSTRIAVFGDALAIEAKAKVDAAFERAETLRARKQEAGLGGKTNG